MRYLTILGISLTLLSVFFFTMQQFKSSSSATFYSQASQDKFVNFLLYKIQEKKTPGYYLEIGAADPIEINNTFFFEKNLNWKGVSIEIDPNFSEKWSNSRKNPLIIGDATVLDYKKVLDSFPKEIDYLTLDIDQHYDTVLKKIPFENYIFKVITIEHDFWRYGDEFRSKERDFLTANGYELIAPDIWLHSNASFEDWWVHKDSFSSSDIEKLKSLDLKNKNHIELIKSIQTLKK